MHIWISVVTKGIVAILLSFWATEAASTQCHCRWCSLDDEATFGDMKIQTDLAAVKWLVLDAFQPGLADIPSTSIKRTVPLKLCSSHSLLLFGGAGDIFCSILFWPHMKKKKTKSPCHLGGLGREVQFFFLKMATLTNCFELKKILCSLKSLTRLSEPTLRLGRDAQTSVVANFHEEANTCGTLN